MYSSPSLFQFDFVPWCFIHITYSVDRDNNIQSTSTILCVQSTLRFSSRSASVVIQAPVWHSRFVACCHQARLGEYGLSRVQMCEITSGLAWCEACHLHVQSHANEVILRPVICDPHNRQFSLWARSLHLRTRIYLSTPYHGDRAWKTPTVRPFLICILRSRRSIWRPFYVWKYYPLTNIFLGALSWRLFSLLTTYLVRPSKYSRLSLKLLLGAFVTRKRHMQLICQRQHESVTFVCRQISSRVHSD